MAKPWQEYWKASRRWWQDRLSSRINLCTMMQRAICLPGTIQIALATHMVDHLSTTNTILPVTR